MKSVRGPVWARYRAWPQYPRPVRPAPAATFDEKLEQMWIKQWLLYANSVRYASAMSGPDYATFKNGWWYLTTNLEEMHQYIREHEK